MVLVEGKDGGWKGRLIISLRNPFESYRKWLTPMKWDPIVLLQAAWLWAGAGAESF